MVLTDRQRADLHAGIYEYLQSRPGDAFAKAAQALAEADPHVLDKSNGSSSTASKTPLLEKKWTAIPRLQKKVLELERQAAHSATSFAHRTTDSTRRRLPRLPATHTLQGHELVVTSVAVHPVFTIVASGSEDGTIKIWDHESGDYIKTLKGHTNTVNSVAFSPSGTHLASCSTDLSIKLWQVSTWTCLRTLRGHDHTISAVRFVPSVGLTATTSTTTTRETSTGLDAATAGSSHLLSASRDATVKRWDVETGFCDATYNDHSDWVRCLAVRGDGNVWASSGNDTVICVYSDKDNSRPMHKLRGHEHVVEALAFVTEEQMLKSGQSSKQSETVRDYLASGSRDRTVRLWKVSDGSCLTVLTAHENWVRSVLIHPSGNYILSGSDDKSIRVFDIKNSRCLRTLEKAHEHFVTSLDMHPTLPILVSGSVDQTVRCWQLD